MKKTAEFSANEVEMLVLKAARGGGLPLGHAQDLSAAIAFVDLENLQACPCAGDPAAALSIPIALDLVAAGEGAQTVTADHAIIAAFVALAERTVGKTLGWEATPTGAIFHGFVDAPPTVPVKFGRRTLPDTLCAHLTDMADRLLVPETDASRAGGAGAGLTDND